MNELERYYNKFNEDKRLLSRHGQVEFFIANHYIEEGLEIIFLDATHINEASRHKILSKLNNIEDYVLVVETIKIPVEIAIERNNKREGFAKVPESAIRKMVKDFVAPTMAEFEKYKFASVHLVNFYE